jgi:hypothetical protein
LGLFGRLARQKAGFFGLFGRWAWACFLGRRAGLLGCLAAGAAFLALFGARAAAGGFLAYWRIFGGGGGKEKKW